MTPAGVITETTFVYESDMVSTGADGNLWTALPSAELASRIAPANRLVSDFSFASTSHGSAEGIAPGADGNLWFTLSGGSDEIARLASGAPAAQVSAPAITGGSQAGSALTCVGGQWASWAGQQPSSSRYGFDGVRWLLDGSVVASGASYTPSSAAAGHSLSCTETATYPLLNVTTSSASAAVIVTAVPAPPAPGLSTPLLLSGLSQRAATWRGGGRLASISSARRAPVGTSFSFTLNQAANASLLFSRSVPGRSVGGRCLAQSRRNAHRHACKRLVKAGVLSLSAHAGLNAVAFQGRLSSSSRLPVGRYTLTLSASNASGRSGTAKVSFTIVR